MIDFKTLERQYEVFRLLALAILDFHDRRRWLRFLMALWRIIPIDEAWQRHLRRALSFSIKVIEDEIRKELFDKPLLPGGPLYICDSLKCELQHGQKSFISAEGRGNQS